MATHSQGADARGGGSISLAPKRYDLQGLARSSHPRTAVRYRLPGERSFHLLLANVHLKERYCQGRSKGSKQRMVPLNPRAVEAITEYLQNTRPRLVGPRDPQTVPWLILSRSGRRLRREAIWELVKRYALRVDVDPQSARTPCGIALHSPSGGGADLRQIRKC